MPKLYFGGAAKNDGADAEVITSSRRPLCTLTQDEFERSFRFWLDRVWVNEEAVPTSANELAAFDELSLVDRYYSTYEHVEVPARGKTLEEMWLSYQLFSGRTATCVLNNIYVDQPTARISRKEVLEPGVLVEKVCERLAIEPAKVVTAVSTGDTGHIIYLISMDRDRGVVIFLDPWPGESLLSAAHNRLGVDAQPSSFGSKLWEIDIPDLERVLVAVFVYTHAWETAGVPIGVESRGLVGSPEERAAIARGLSLLERGNGSASTGAEIGSAFRDMEEAVLAAVRRQIRPAYGVAQLWHHMEPYSAAAAACAAREYAEVLQLAGQEDSAIHWWRHAAMMRDAKSATSLAAVLAAKSADLESDFWEQRSAHFASLHLEPHERPLTSEELMASVWATPDAITRWRQGPHFESHEVARKHYERADVLCAGGDLPGARANYLQVAELCDPFVSAQARVLLARMLEDHGDWEEAAEEYLLASVMTNYDWSTYALFDLAKLRQNQGSHEEATELLVRVAESGHREASGRAAFDAYVLLATKDPLRAIRALEISSYTNDVDSWPVGAVHLGGMLYAVGRTDEARRSLDRAAGSGNTRVLPLLEQTRAKLGMT